ncbi:MAG: PaaI family thioesterase [Acidobacteriota bacterium]
MTTEHLPADGAANGHRHCLFCGDWNPASLRLSFTVGHDGMVRSIFHANPRLQGYDGILHGGVVGALLDAAMTHCLFHHGVQALTGDLRVRFRKPVPCEALLELRAWLLSERPPLYRLAAELLHDNHVVAKAEAKFMRRGAASRHPLVRAV